MTEAGGEEAGATREPRPRRGRWRAVAALAAAVALLASPWWGTALLRRLDFFRVRSVEIVGVRYLRASEVVQRLAVDTLASVWDDPAPLEARVRTHPQVRDVTVRRRLPGTLVVRVEEDAPVAFVPGAKGLAVVDDRGRPLPIDPSATNIDLPIVGSRDTTVLALLRDVRAAAPALFGRISEVRRVGREELLVRLVSVPVRAMADVSAARLAEVVAVEEDLARRHAAVAELDLRFRDQVIARLQ